MDGEDEEKAAEASDMQMNADVFPALTVVMFPYSYTSFSPTNFGFFPALSRFPVTKPNGLLKNIFSPSSSLFMCGKEG